MDIFEELEKCGQDKALGLIRKLDDINITDNYSDSLLHIAASKNWKRVIKELIERGADLYYYNSSDELPLDCAFPDLDCCLLIAEAGGRFSDYYDTDLKIVKLAELINPISRSHDNR